MTRGTDCAGRALQGKILLNGDRNDRKSDMLNNKKDAHVLYRGFVRHKGKSSSIIYCTVHALYVTRCNYKRHNDMLDLDNCNSWVNTVQKCKLKNRSRSF